MQAHRSSSWIIYILCVNNLNSLLNKFTPFLISVIFLLVGATMKIYRCVLYESFLDTEIFTFREHCYLCEEWRWTVHILINCSIWHLLVTNLCSSSPMSSLLTIHSHRLQMKCECPKGKRAFAEVRSATAPPGGSACAGRRVMPTTPTGCWSCLSATWTTWDVAAYPKESTKRAFESLSDNFSQDSLMSF